MFYLVLGLFVGPLSMWGAATPTTAPLMVWGAYDRVGYGILVVLLDIFWWRSWTWYATGPARSRRTYVRDTAAPVEPVQPVQPAGRRVVVEEEVGGPPAGPPPP